MLIYYRWELSIFTLFILDLGWALTIHDKWKWRRTLFMIIMTLLWPSNTWMRFWFDKEKVRNICLLLFKSGSSAIYLELHLKLLLVHLMIYLFVFLHNAAIISFFLLIFLDLLSCLILMLNMKVSCSLSINNTGKNLRLKLKTWINHGIESIFTKKVININRRYLTNSMGTIFCLNHDTRSPIHFCKDNCWGSCQSDACTRSSKW